MIQIPPISIMHLTAQPLDDPNALLANDFLNRGDSMLLVGFSGGGKSTLINQLAMGWALCRPTLGFTPVRPLVTLVIQAENSGQDSRYIRNGLLRMGNYDDYETELIEQRVMFSYNNEQSGELFIKKGLVQTVESAKVRPDLVVIDPAFSFLGGDNNSGEYVTKFLREWVTPVTQKLGICPIFVHHAAKPPQSDKDVRRCIENISYLVSGSSEWSNWSRRAIAIVPKPDNTLEADLMVGKGHDKLGWNRQSLVRTVGRPYWQGSPPEYL